MSILLKRRRFIRDAGLLSSGLLAGSAIGCFPPRKQRGNTSKLGVALVGLGYYSRDLLAPALQLTQYCELRGIVTGTPAKIPRWQEKYGIPDRNVYDYDNFHQIANNEDIDVIYVVLPTALHKKYVIQGAEARKHVWCEKPMAMTVAECQEMIDACLQNGVKLSIGYRMQHEPNTRTIMEFAKTKPYGEIVSLRAEAGYVGGGGSGWRFKKDMGGGALYDMGVYTVNAIRYASWQNPVSVSAKHLIHRPEIFTEVDETTEYSMTFQSGLMASGRASVGENLNLLRADCENGWYELSPMQSYTGVQGRTSNGMLLNKPIENQQARQMDDDALAILNNTDVLVPGEDGLADIRIIEALSESAARGGEEVLIGQ